MASIQFIHVGGTPRAPLTIQIPELNEYKVGQYIEYTGDMANNSGHGAIVNIEPADRWGGPYAHIILTDGRDMPRNEIRHIRPLAERRGCAHRLLAGDEIATPSQIAELFAAAALRKADLAAKQDAANEEFSAEVEQITAANPDLIQGDDHKTAAKNIRKLLKAAFPTTKFSVVVPHWGTINVRWTDGPATKEVEAITDQFEEGHFDGSDDCYKYSTSPWNKTFGGAKYVFCNRDKGEAA